IRVRRLLPSIWAVGDAPSLAAMLFFPSLAAMVLSITNREVLIEDRRDLPVHRAAGSGVEVLLDPKIIAQCMPGCESMNEVAPDQYEAVMKVGVASVKGTYKGKVSIKDKQPPSHYVLSGQGSGGPGFMQGDVAIDLEEAGGQTVLKYSTDAKVGGLIASVGQRMLNGVAKMMVDQFFKKVESFI